MFSARRVCAFPRGFSNLPYRRLSSRPAKRGISQRPGFNPRAGRLESLRNGRQECLLYSGSLLTIHAISAAESLHKLL
jgi:hypothetical protein